MHERYLLGLFLAKLCSKGMAEIAQNDSDVTWEGHQAAAAISGWSKQTADILSQQICLCHFRNFDCKP